MTVDLHVFAFIAGILAAATVADPRQVATNDRKGVTATFGSAEDVHLLESLPLSRARFVISAIPLLETNRALLLGLRHHNYQGRIALTAHTRRDSERLRAAGADIVLEPFAFAAAATIDTLDRAVGAATEEGHPRSRWE